jgi:hypothetical protein
MFFEQPKIAPMTFQRDPMIDYSDLDSGGSVPSAGNETSFLDVWEQSRKAAETVTNFNARHLATEEAIDRRIARIKELTGVEIENPYRIKGLVGKNQASRGEPGSAWDFYEKRTKEIAEKYPQFAEEILPTRRLEAEQALVGREYERSVQEAMQRYGPGWSKYAALFGGAMHAIIKDPVNLPAMLLGPVGPAGQGLKGLLWMAIKQGAVNAGVETVNQLAAVQSRRRDIGLPSGIDYAAFDIATAAAFGFTADAGVRGAIRGVQTARGKQANLDEKGRIIGWRDKGEAAPKPPVKIEPEIIAKAEAGDIESIKTVAKKLDIDEEPAVRGLIASAEADDMMVEAAREAGLEIDDGEGLNKVAQALRAVVDEDEPPPISQPVSERGTTSLADVPQTTKSFEVDGKPVRLSDIDLKKTVTDATTFQFKSGGDAQGATGRLSGVERWDPLAAGRAVVFRRQNGELVIADAHQRRSLAVRLTEEETNVPAFVFNEADGWTPADVRAMAAKKNIQEGSGSAVDAAQMMRERPDIVDKSLPLSTGKMRTARLLSRLSDEAFGFVASGTIDPKYAAAVAEHVSDPTRHSGIMKDLVELAPSSEREARIAVGQMLQAGTFVETQMTLLGSHIEHRSLMKERVKVLNSALKELSNDRRVFGMLRRESGRIERAGNELADDVNAQMASQAAEAAETIERLAQQRGPVSTWLSEAAHAVAEGQPANRAGEAFANRIRKTLDEEGIAGLTREPDEPRLIDEPHGRESQAQIEELEGRIEPEQDQQRLLFAISAKQAADRIEGQIKTRQDALGFYSKAVEAARGLKQKKGTPEQMLSQLKKAGVKQSELDATSLEAVMKGEKSVTKEEIIEHLEMSRVAVMEARYGLTSEQEHGALNTQLFEQFTRDYPDMDPVQLRQIVDDVSWHGVGERESPPLTANIIEMASPEARSIIDRLQSATRDTKWKSYSLDPSNPTYRETVLHLSEIGNAAELNAKIMDRSIPAPERDRIAKELEAVRGQNFKSGHFDEPNAISHLRTSMQPDAQGKQNFVINELQSDWGQKLRDSGPKDDAKIDELEKQIKAANKRAHDRRMELGDPEDSYVIYRDEIWKQASQEEERLIAELNTAKQSAPSHPLVNTTDQWVNTSLRRALRQAVQDDADYIAIASGETVDHFGMGAPLDGLKYAYNEMYPKKLRDIIKKLDKDAAKPEAYREIKTTDGKPYRGQMEVAQDGFGMWHVYRKDQPLPDVKEFKTKEEAEAFAGIGFTRFPITDKLRQAVMEEGLPLFSLKQEADGARAVAVQNGLDSLGDPEAKYPSPQVQHDMPALRREIDKIIRRLPKGHRIELEERLVFGSDEIDAQFDPYERLIKVSLANEDPARLARHEEIHAYRQLGLFSDDEWNALTTFARENKLREKYEIDQRYSQIYGERHPDDPQKLEEMLIEETIAEMWADRVAGNSLSRPVNTIIDRVVRFLRRIAEALKLRGYSKIDDIYQRIESGEIGERADPRYERVMPDRFYHGTVADVETELKPGRNAAAVFMASDVQDTIPFTNSIIGEPGPHRNNSRVLPLAVEDGRYFDFRNSDHINLLRKDVPEIDQLAAMDNALPSDGPFGMFSDDRVIDWLRRNNFDGWWEVETVGNPASRDSLAVMSPGKIKSATTGNLLFSFRGEMDQVQRMHDVNDVVGACRV